MLKNTLVITDGIRVVFSKKNLLKKVIYVIFTTEYRHKQNIQNSEKR